MGCVIKFHLKMTRHVLLKILNGMKSCIWQAAFRVLSEILHYHHVASMYLGLWFSFT